MIINEVNTAPSQWAVRLETRDTPFTTAITTPWIRLTEDGQTCDSEGLEPVADASECQEAIKALNGIPPDGKQEETDIEMSRARAPFGCSTACILDEWEFYYCQKFNTFKSKHNQAVDSSEHQYVYCRASSPSETAIGKIKSGGVFANDKYTVLKSTGKCPKGTELTVKECKDLGSGGVFSDWRKASVWKRTCGCFIDQDGDRYFNHYTRGCNRPGRGEKMICKTEIPGWQFKGSGDCRNSDIPKLTKDHYAAFGCTYNFPDPFKCAGVCERYPDCNSFAQIGRRCCLLNFIPNMVKSISSRGQNFCYTKTEPDLGCGPGNPAPSGCDNECGSTAVDEGCGCGKKCAVWTQDWTCKTNRGWQLLPEENDTWERFEGAFPDDDRAAECLSACQETDKECCRLNYDYTPARCHAGMIINEVNTAPSQWAVRLETRDTPFTTAITTPWIRLTEDGQTCDSEGLEPVADASECQEAIKALNGIPPDGKQEETDIEMSRARAPFGCSTACILDEWEFYYCQKFNTFKSKHNQAVDSSEHQYVYCRASSPSETAIGKINYTALESSCFMWTY